jgi:hypothetical protein
MMLKTLLQRAGFLQPQPPSDQTYHEASVDNALIDRDKLTTRINEISQSGEHSNATLLAGIARVKSSSSRDLMADLVRGMKQNRG